MSLPIIYQEGTQATFEKRFFAGHYAFRDFYTVATGLDPTATLASYAFGTAARLISHDNWPMQGDGRRANELFAMNTYARLVRVQCTEDVFILITSLNPRWIELYLKYLFLRMTPANAVTLLATQGIAQTITDVPHLIGAGTIMAFYPLYGVGITFYGVPGIIRIWSAGNTEGKE